jgi:lysozyme
MAVTFIIDISHHQDKSLDLAQTRRDGCEACFIKAGEGGSFVDSDFASNLAEARAAGQIPAAYWYQRSSASAAAHVAKIKQVVPRDVPIILDVEANSGGVSLTREIISQLNTAGYRTPLLYLPKWYWQQIGSPSLAGLPSLWSSRYPNNVVGTLASEWAEAPASYWGGYGGLDAAVLQFTSSARIAGYQPLDASAFRGTREELEALLIAEEKDMPLTTADAATLFWGAKFDGDDNYAQYLKGSLARLEAGQQALLAALQAATKDPDITLESLSRIVNEAIASNIRITGTVEISSSDGDAA